MKKIALFTYCIVHLLIPQAQDRKEQILATQDLADKKQWSQAASSLDPYLDECGDYCIEVNFSYGYLNQALYRQYPDSSTFLQTAVSSYTDVLRSDPNHVPARNNLFQVYYALGQNEDALATLEQAPEDVKEEFLLATGKVYYLDRQYDLAFDRYTEYLKSDPTSEVAYRALKDLFLVEAFDSQTVHRYCKKMIDNNFVVFAKQSLMGSFKLSNSNDGRYDIATFLWWVKLVGESQSVRSDFNRNLQASWNHQMIREIREVVSSSTGRPIDWKELRWWNTEKLGVIEEGVSFQINEVMCRTLIGLGDEAARDGKILEAEYFLELARDFIANGNLRSALSRDKVPNGLLLAVERLCLLYVRYGNEIVDSEAKFRSLERSLFQAKNKAYLYNNQPAIYPFHRTLGLIYASKKNWGDSDEVRSAHFQLEHAIEKAPESFNTAYLYELNATGYAEQGQRATAIEWFANSAIQYERSGDSYAADFAIERAANSDLGIEPAQMYSITALFAQEQGMLAEGYYFAKKSIDFKSDFSNLAIISDILEVRGDTASASKYFREALETQSEAKAPYYYGRYLLTQSKNEKAFKVFTKLSTINAGDSLAMNGFAHHFAAQGQYGTAIEYLNKSVVKTSNSTGGEWVAYRRLLKNWEGRRDIDTDLDLSDYIKQIIGEK